MAVKKATYQVDNGTGFDEIMFKTMAAQVKMASGVDLEAGFANSKASSGYTKLPNGIMVQWGGLWVSTDAWRKTTVNFPVAFPTDCTCVLPGCLGNEKTDKYSYVTSQACNAVIESSGQFTLVTTITTGSGTDAKGRFLFRWVAIGY